MYRWYPLVSGGSCDVLLRERLFPQHFEDVQGKDIPNAGANHREPRREPLAQDLAGVAHRTEDNLEGD